MNVVAFHIALALACSIAGPFRIPLPFADDTPQAPPRPCQAVIDGTSEYGINRAFVRVHRRVDEFVKSYAYDHMVPVNLVLRSPEAFGPWQAEWDPTLTEAMDDGSLTEWDWRYYITHNWSSYGQDILSMQPGDMVVVNDLTVRIEGLFDYPKASRYCEVLALMGDALPTMGNAVGFQTCVPDSDYNRIVFGSVEESLVEQGS